MIKNLNNHISISAKTILLCFSTFSISNVMGQEQNGNLLEKVILQVFKNYIPSDSIVYIDVFAKFDNISKPPMVFNKKIVYVNPGTLDKVFLKNTDYKVIRVFNIEATDSLLIIHVTVLNASCNKVKCLYENPDFYLELHFKYDCSVNEYMHYKTEKK